MSEIKETLEKVWADRQKFIIFTTVDGNNTPNSVYIGYASLYDENTLLLADNKMSKTKDNVLKGSKGSVLFITSETKSYQLKGSLSYLTEGDYFTDMKKWNREDLPGYGVVVLKIEEIYSGADKLY